MSHTAQDGGFVFPREHLGYEGITLRDYIATKVVQSILANPTTDGPTPQHLSAVSYEIADAMLIARKERKDA